MLLKGIESHLLFLLKTCVCLCVCVSLCACAYVCACACVWCILCLCVTFTPDVSWQSLQRRSLQGPGAGEMQTWAQVGGEAGADPAPKAAAGVAGRPLP